MSKYLKDNPLFLIFFLIKYEHYQLWDVWKNSTIESLSYTLDFILFTIYNYSMLLYFKGMIKWIKKVILEI